MKNDGEYKIRRAIRDREMISQNPKDWTHKIPDDFDPECMLDWDTKVKAFNERSNVAYIDDPNDVEREGQISLKEWAKVRKRMDLYSDLIRLCAPRVAESDL